jgi:hypothetical protein
MVILLTLGVLIGAFGLVLPLLPMAFPRLGPGMLYAMRTIRVATIEGSLLLGIIAVAVFADMRAWYGMGVILVLAVLAQALYPQKVIATAVDPEHVTPETAAESRKAVPEQAVIGVEMNGEACAWSLDLLYHHQVTLDYLAGKPLLLTACAASRYARVYSAEVRGQTLTFEVAGYYRRNLVLRDRETGSLWQQATGEALMGRLAGARLTPVAAGQLTWGAWQAAFPTSVLAVEWFQKHGWAPAGIVNALLCEVPARTTAPGLSDLGSALSPHSEVSGICFKGEARAYPLAALAQAGLVSDRVGGVPLAIWFDPAADRVSAVERLVNGAEVTLELRNGQLIAGSGGRWDQFGQPVDGGEALRPVPVARLWWLGWKEFHPKSSLFQT